MANQTKKSGGSDFDPGMEFAADEFSFEDPVGDSREPAKPVTDGIKKAFKSHLTSESTLRKYVSKSLPPQYETMFGTAVKAKDTMEEVFDEVGKATKKPLNDLAKLMEQRLPQKWSKGRNFAKWLKDATDEMEFEKTSQAKIDQNETQAALSGMDTKLTELLAAQGQVAEDARQREEERTNIKRAEDYLLFTTQNKILTGMQRDLQIMSGYTTSIDYEHKRKMLETTYRMAFGIRDIASKLNELTEISRGGLKGIQHNTGLPEEQKLTLYERGKGNLKNRFINKTLGRFSDGSNNFMDNFIDRMGKNLINTGRDVGDIIRQGTFMTDMLTDNQDDFSGMSQEDQARKRYAQMIAGMGLDAVGPKAVGKAANKLRGKAPRLEAMLQRFGSKGGYAVGNAHSLAKNFAYSNDTDDGFFKKLARGLVGMALPGTDQENGLDLAHGDKLGQATHTDLQMRRAQVEVMPGLMSLMLRELRFIRTGEDPGLLHFDYKKGGFKTTKQAKADILGSLKRNTFMKQNMDTLTTGITDGMADSEKLELQKHLLYKKRSGATMTERSLMNENFYDHVEDPAKRKEIAARFAKFLDSEGGKFSDTNKANERREWFFSNLSTAADYSTDNRAAIQQAANEGHAPLLRQMGIIDENNNITKDGMYLWDLVSDPKIDDEQLEAPMGRGRGRGDRLTDNRRGPRGGPRGGAPATPGFGGSTGTPNLSFRGYTQRGIGSNTFAPASTKRLDTDESGRGAIRTDKFDLLADMVKQMNENHGRTLEEIRDNTAKLGIYYVQNAQITAGQSGDADSIGFWDKTLGEHVKGMGNRGAAMAKKVGGLGRKTISGVKDFVTGDNAFTGWARSLKGMGARYMEDLKDGLPRLGDVYVQGLKGAVITKAMLAQGLLRDSKGNVIRTLADIANTADDIYDEAGNVVLTQANKLRSYLRGDGFQFAKKWSSFVFKKSKELGEKLVGVGKDMFSFGQKAAERIKSMATGALYFAAEVVAPTKDVYVKGESSPKLYASLIRKGWYRDAKSGKVIFSETQIQGPLIDPDDNIALSTEDITKGLVDVEGNPIRSIREIAADFVRSNFKSGINRVKNAMAFTRNAAIGAAKGTVRVVRGFGQAVTKFLRFGASGFGSDNAAQQAGQAASEDANLAAGMTVSLLTQIRDILANSLGTPPGMGVGLAAGAQQAAAAAGQAAGNLKSKFQNWVASKGSPAAAPGGGVDTSVDTTGNTANYSQASAMSAPGDIFKSLGSGAMAGAVGMGRNVMKRWRNRRGRGRGGDVGGGGDTGEGVSREDLKNAIDESRKEGEKLTIKDRLKTAKDRMMEGVRNIGKRQKKEGDGEEPKEGSIAALRKKMRGTFQNFRDEREHNFQDYGNKNSIDLMIDAVKGAKDRITGLFGDAADALPDGEGRDKKGKKGRGRGKGGKAAQRAASKKAAQIASQKAAEKAGQVAASKAAQTAATAGAAALGRKAAIKGGLIWGAKKAALAIGGGIAAVLGAPMLGTALAVAGGLWTAKSMYDWFMSNPRDIDKPKPGNANLILNSVRMIEYGVGLDGAPLMARLRAFEDLVAPAVKGEPGALTIDSGKIDAERALKLFGIEKTSGEAVDGMLVWMESRFKPTFLKWMDFATLAKIGIGELDKLEDEKRLKILDETERNNTGWDVMSSPFNGATLQIDAEAVKAHIENARNLIKRNKNVKDSGADPKDPYASEKKNLKGVQPMLQGAAEKRAADYQGKLMGLSETGSGTMAANAARDSSSFSSFKSAKHAKATYGVVDELTSIRMRAYGFGMLTAANLTSTENLEKFVYKFMTFDNGGTGNFNGDMNLVLEEAARVYGFSFKDPAQRDRANIWLTKRFMPVFVEFSAAVRVNIGKMDLHDGLQALTPAAKVTVATAILSHDEIWSVRELPTYGIEASTDAASVKPFMERLEAIARDKTLTELNKAPPQRFGEDVNSSTQSMRNQPEMQKTVYRPAENLSPVQKAFSGNDAETEPKGQSSGGGSPPSAPSAGLTIAEGKPYAGNNADQYLDLRKGAKLEGLHPEVKKLFLGMVEEYGTHTGLKVGVNSGFRSFAEQDREYRANPGKAAKPGGSLHESGLAIDIDSATADKLEKLGLMRKYGFTRPVGGEPWHIEPAGIQGAISQAKANPDSFTSAIVNSAGKGGGGVGMTRTGYPMGKRDSNAAIGYQTAGAQTVKNDSDRKLPPGSIALPSSGTGSSPSGSKSSGGYGGSIMNAGNGTAGAGTYASLPTGGGVEGAKKLVQESAKVVGIDPDAAMVKVSMESGFQSGAKADGSSGGGLWQMTKGAWSDMMRQHGQKYGIPPNATPMDDRANALLGSEYVKMNMGIAEKKGLPTDLMSAYIMHFFGPGGGPKFMRLEDGAVVAKEMPDMAAVPGNKNVFYDKSGRARTKGEMLAYFKERMDSAAKSIGIAPPSGSMTGTPDGSAPPPVNSTDPRDRQSSPSQPSRSNLAGPMTPPMEMQQVAAQPAASSQDTGLQALSKEMLGTKTIQQKQLTALESILGILTEMKDAVAQGSVQAKAPAAPSVVTPPAPAAPSGSQRRAVSPPLV